MALLQVSSHTPGNPIPACMERRGDVRTRVLFDTLYSAGRTEGEVTLTDVSSSGALVEGASECPPIGTDVRLLVLPPGEETGVENCSGLLDSPVFMSDNRRF